MIPDDCALRVGGEDHHWREGEVVVFDDTYEHEAWNRSSRTRVVMIFDLWNPVPHAGRARRARRARDRDGRIPHRPRGALAHATAAAFHTTAGALRPRAAARGSRVAARGSLGAASQSHCRQYLVAARQCRRRRERRRGWRHAADAAPRQTTVRAPGSRELRRGVEPLASAAPRSRCRGARARRHQLSLVLSRARAHPHRHAPGSAVSLRRRDRAHARRRSLVVRQLAPAQRREPDAGSAHPSGRGYFRQRELLAVRGPGRAAGHGRPRAPFRRGAGRRAVSPSRVRCGR